MNFEHLVIAYAVEDAAFANRLMADLTAARIPVRLNDPDFAPGTSAWEQAARQAVESAAGMILVASPAARDSAAVTSLLALARVRQCPVYPVWTGGGLWVDCVPLRISGHAYYDGREERYAATLQQMLQAFQPIFADPPRSIQMRLPSHEAVSIHTDGFHLLRDFLNHIYVNHLQDWYGVFTYGRDWLLCHTTTRRLAVPWDWLVNAPEQMALSRSVKRWADVPMSHFGIEPGGEWAVLDVPRVTAVGIAVHGQALVSRILAPYGARELKLMTEDRTLVYSAPKKVQIHDYPFKFVVAAWGTDYNRDAFVQPRV